ncbi:MAG: NAD(P)-dependent alcohol dehydrogenase [Planctomycetota bacterium]|jgi:uncharacterized zinc-type alcohol dehydrogenase-like protein
MIINAMAVAEAGGTLSSWTYECPPLGPHDCLIKVKTCGICYSDVHMMDNDWQISQYPLVPGHEMVGEVVDTGAQVQQFAKGDRVGVGWQRTSCLVCRDCLEGHENLCNDTQGVITHGHGGFADHLVMDSRFCFPLPEALSTEKAGPLLCGGITVFSALLHAGMTSGQHIGVIGVGGLGHMAVQFASRMGNCVTVFTTSKDKAEFARILGAHEAVALEGGKVPDKLDVPLDILLNTVHVHLDWNAYLNLLGSDGVLTYVGVPAGPSEIDLTSLLFKRRRVMASPIGGRADMYRMLDIAAQLGIEPMVETFPLSECNAAIEKVRENRVRYRAVLLVD